MTSNNIAVCLVGRIRGYENNKSSFESFTSELQKKFDNVYFFVSLNSSRDQYHKDFETYINNLTHRKCQFRYENFNLGHLENTTYNTMRNMTSMFYNQFKCMEMIYNHNLHFNIVVKWRTEISFREMFQFENTLEKQTVYIPSDFDWGGINDQIAYGDFESMKLYSDLFKHLLDYIHIRAHPETLLQHHLNKYVKIERFRFPYHLQR